eukprot:CAMPEP_0172485052 /NCGR_PEP_ID=MMETSP1066-20121228/12811_1 /TAXON_ID=671091 /ORGANISM="Coscinodiscus wailesii, Strain CCMP2513" /LENGTH=435 /DNA_ID=CAMNT_0013249975 /DNA_START=325 /DNA_END=1632 /DNA_ORIENTATION=-
MSHSPIKTPETLLAEKEAELAELLNTYDEYVTSSKLLEDELEQELTQMRSALEKSNNARNNLKRQVQDLTSLKDTWTLQRSKLEEKLSKTNENLAHEKQLRFKAETELDRAESQIREQNETIKSYRKELESAHEEIAFRNMDMDDLKSELETLKNQKKLQADTLSSQMSHLEDAKSDLETAKAAAIRDVENTTTKLSHLVHLLNRSELDVRLQSKAFHTIREIAKDCGAELLERSDHFHLHFQAPAWMPSSHRRVNDDVDHFLETSFFVPPHRRCHDRNGEYDSSADTTIIFSSDIDNVGADRAGTDVDKDDNRRDENDVPNETEKNEIRDEPSQHANTAEATTQSTAGDDGKELDSEDTINSIIHRHKRAIGDAACNDDSIGNARKNHVAAADSCSLESLWSLGEGVSSAGGTTKPRSPNLKKSPANVGLNHPT